MKEKVVEIRAALRNLQAICQAFGRIERKIASKGHHIPNSFDL